MKKLRDHCRYNTNIITRIKSLIIKRPLHVLRSNQAIFSAVDKTFESRERASSAFFTEGVQSNTRIKLFLLT